VVPLTPGAGNLGLSHVGLRILGFLGHAGVAEELGIPPSVRVGYILDFGQGKQSPAS